MKKYHNKKIISNIGIIMASLVMAIGINIFIIDGTQSGDNFKTSILNSTNIESKANIYLEKQEDSIIVKNSNQINNSKSISLSLSYNSDNINIGNLSSTYGTPVIISNTPGISSIILNTKGETIKNGSTILNINFSKNNTNSENMNLINVNFTDTDGGKYDLSTSGITF